jgi:hypothetical protein
MKVKKKKASRRRTVTTVKRGKRLLIKVKDHRSGAVWDYELRRTSQRGLFGRPHLLCIRCASYYDATHGGSHGCTVCARLERPPRVTQRVKLDRHKLDELACVFDLSEQDLCRIAGKAHSYINEQFKRGGSFALHTVWDWCRIMDINVPIFLEQCGKENPFADPRRGQGD